MTGGVPRPAGAGKMAGLELLRFISALAVLFWHYQHFAFIAGQPVGFVREHQPLYGMFSFFYQYGYHGVQVFWCLSGFIFFWKYREALAAHRIGAGKFFLLRFSRLYPLHIVTLLVVAVLQLMYFRLQGYFFVYQHNDLHHFLLQLGLASHWGLQNGYSFNGPIWSISIEVLAYLVFFLSLRFIGRTLWVNVAVVLAFIAARWAPAPVYVLDCVGLFYAGGLAAVAFRRFEGAPRARLVNGALLVLLVAAPLLAWPHIPRDDRFVHLFLLFYLPPLFYLCAQRLPLPARLLPAIDAAGNMTYSSYLVHFPIQLALAWYFAARQQPIPYESPRLFWVFMTATLVAAYCVFRWFELPAQRYLRRRFGAA